MLPVLTLTAELHSCPENPGRRYWVVKDPNKEITAFLPDDRWNGALRWPVGGNPYHV